MMNPIEANACIYNTQMGYGLPLSGAATVETLLPTLYGSVISDLKTDATPIQSESGLTYNNIQQQLLPRKRSRETYSSSSNIINPLLSLQLEQQHQFDVERLVSQHMEKVRVEIEENRKKQARRIIEAIEEGMMKRLRAKEDEIQKIGKLNSALEDRVKSLCMENQIWRDLAQTNEAAANALRTNLEQVLASSTRLDDAAVMDDAQSCCGSTSCGGAGEAEERRMVVNVAHHKGDRMCRNCGKGGARVLLLPCRHLCLCTVCGSNLHVCPVCKSAKNASVLVNMS